jgi:integrase
MAVRDLWHHVNVAEAIKKGVKPCNCGRGQKLTYPTLKHGLRGRWRAELDVNGQRYGNSGTYDSKTEAKAHFDKLKEQANKGKKPADKNRGKESLRSHLEDYVNNRVTTKGRRPARGTRNLGRTYLNTHIMPFFGEDTTLADINAQNLNKFRDHMSTKQQPSGEFYARQVVVNVYSLVASALKNAVQEQKLTENPSVYVRYPVLDARTDFVLWEDDLVKRLLSAMPDFDRTIAQVAANCGHRQGEAFGVCVEDIGSESIRVLHQVGRDEAGTLRLIPPKNESVRQAVPLPAGTARALAKHLREHDPIPVTCTCHPGKTWSLVFHAKGPGRAARGPSQPLVNNRWNLAVWKPALAAVATSYASEGLTCPVDLQAKRRTGMHQLRHHAISLWLYGGATDVAAAAWAGHTSTAMVKRIYAHVFGAEGSRGRAIMDKVYYGDESDPPALRAIG